MKHLNKPFDRLAYIVRKDKTMEVYLNNRRVSK